VLEPGTARLLLLLVPLCWGTYNPSLRLLYSLPEPPSPAEVSGVRLSIAVLPYLPTLLSAAFAAAAPAMQASRSAEQSPDVIPPPQGEFPVAAAGETDWGAVSGASLELGLWNLLGTAGQAWGLEHTSAVHAAVLLSSINVMVPLGASLSGERVRPTTWLACALVLGGIGLLNADIADTPADVVAMGISPGDAAVLCAAASYSAYTVRLSTYAKRVPTLPLAAGKTAVLGAGCITWACAEAVHAHGTHALGLGDPAHVSGLWGAAGPDVALVAWLCLTFSALVPGSLATFLQAKGQSGVSAPEAQVILALTPVVSICIAAALLGERIGPNVLQAGGVMLGATALCIAADVHAGAQKRLNQS
jgi:drug/metabolite transporter (DMT)-like permease